MPGRIPDSKIDEVRLTADIVDVIGGYVSLKRRGRNYMALCPFHNEKTPSFSVSPDRQIFHCFGCGKGGNVFTFLMEHEKVSASPSPAMSRPATPGRNGCCTPMKSLRSIFRIR